MRRPRPAPSLLAVPLALLAAFCLWFAWVMLAG